MKSQVIQLCDYKTIQIPEEYLSGKIPEEQIDRQLETLSANYAVDTDADVAQTGDSIACRGESDIPKWNRSLLLFYPGRGLCEPELEDACLGAAVNETRTVSLPEGSVTLTVLCIVRRVRRPIDDALVRLEGIEGVTTVEEYRRWYRETTERELRTQAAGRAVSYLIQEMVKRSRYDINEAERDEWCWDEANRQYDAMTAAGIDLTIPTEGTEFLTEEQARHQIYEEYAAGFPNYLAGVGLLEREGLNVDEVFQAELGRLAEDTKMTVEDMTTQAGKPRLYETIVGRRVQELIGAYVAERMEV